MRTSTDPVDFAFAEAFVESLGSAGNAMDAGRVVDLCAEDVVFDDGGLDKRVVGSDVIGELFGSIFQIMTNMQFEVLDGPLLSQDRQTVSARWRISGSTKQGHEISFETVDFYRFIDGLVCEYTILVRDEDWLDRMAGLPG